MDTIILVIEVIIFIILYKNEWIALLIWFLAIYALQMSYEHGNIGIITEMIEDYPEKDLRKVKRGKFLFAKIEKYSEKGIPKEMYFCELIKFYGLILYSVIMFFVIFFNEHVACVIGIVYLAIVFIIMFYMLSSMTKKCFKKKYRMLNRYNLKYLFVKSNEPKCNIVGEGKVLYVYKKRKRMYASVILIKTKEILDSVLIQVDDVSELKDCIVVINEICNLYYVV